MTTIIHIFSQLIKNLGTFPDENSQIPTEVHVENIFHFVRYFEPISEKKGVNTA